MLEDLKITILKHPEDEDWMLCKKCTIVTIGKDSDKPPTEDWKHRILAAEHSPIRVLPFIFRIENVPSWVSVHLCRHVHATPFVKTQRNDRQANFNRNDAPQSTPVDMCWYMNAQELMVIARKRLCMQASAETRYVVQKICNMVEEVNPEFKGLLVPNCVYRGNTCTEFVTCGLADKLKEKENMKNENMG